ncbi:DUF488 domain-containing protein [Halobacillus litoralis]|uniref:DUF488 domain-containing protein n=1 Tax=Halobacillus litoralis TaxID=45668 RepID=A0A410MED5_9BACI|nr:DUF488 family protein [Halobacillus litoralis]QAS53025.1 DUF488 domain-containing protein [Halobacillus litoralis]
MSVLLRRIYDEEKILGGYRVLVDRVWPRGISKEKAQLDKWTKIIAPSSDLRKWFNHDADKFEGFKEKYLEEINQSPEAQYLLNELKEKVKYQRVILLYGAKDVHHNHAVVLKDWLEKE